jgi:hypothetical protein
MGTFHCACRAGEVVGVIHGVMHEGCHIEFPKPTRVTVHMTKFVEIQTEEERAEMRELAEKGMMGPMGMGFGTRTREERQEAGLWDELEMAYNERQPKKDYKAAAGVDGTTAGRDAAGVPEATEAAAKEAALEEEAEEVLRAGTTVIVSGLVSAPHHNGQQATVLRYDKQKCRYAVELVESGEKLSVRPTCLIEDITGEEVPPPAIEAAAAPSELAGEVAAGAAGGDASTSSSMGKIGGTGGGFREGYTTDYDRWERMAKSQHDIDEDLFKCMNQM